MIEYIEYVDEYSGYTTTEEAFNKCLDKDSVQQFLDMFNIRIEAIPHYEKQYINDETEEVEDIEASCTIEQLAEATNLRESVVKAIIEYKCFHKSPYGNSFYNSDNISWGFKPENSIRISDHWSFESQDEIHCVLQIEGTPLANYYLDDETDILEWLVCRYKNGKYHLVERLY